MQIDKDSYLYCQYLYYLSILLCWIFLYRVFLCWKIQSGYFRFFRLYFYPHRIFQCGCFYPHRIFQYGCFCPHWIFQRDFLHYILYSNYRQFLSLKQHFLLLRVRKLCTQYIRADRDCCESENVANIRLFQVLEYLNEPNRHRRR